MPPLEIPCPAQPQYVLTPTEGLTTSAQKRVRPTAKLIAFSMLRPTQLHSLTVLRFVAALFVVFFHQGQSTALVNAPGWLKNMAGAGYLGVSLFFVLSGFILTYVYTRQAAPIDHRRFWQARFARVYPVYVLGLIVAVPFYLWFIHVGVFSPAALILAPVLLQAWVPTAAQAWNSPGWSLSVEVLFYLLFPFLGVAIAKLRSNFLLPGLLLSWLVMLTPPLLCGFFIDGSWQATAATNTIWINILKFNPVFHLGEFVAGIFAARFFIRYPLNGSLWIPVLAGGAILGIMAVSPSLPYILLHNGLLVPLSALLICGLAYASPNLYVPRGLITLGEASYALYLLHLPIWVLMDGITHRVGYNMRTQVGFWIYLVICLFVSVLAFRYVECPGRNFLNRKFATRQERTKVKLSEP